MSKAVTNEEVEDVLSSIRRLVSEDKRPLAGLRAAPVVAQSGAADPEPPKVADPAVVMPAADRLVLTPALRVAETGDAADADMDAQDDPLDLGLVARETWTPDQDEEAEVQDAATVEEAKAYKGPMMLFPAAQDSVAQDDRGPAMDALDALVQDALEAEPQPVETVQPDEAAAQKLLDDTALEDGDYSDEGYWDDDVDNAEPDYEQTGALNEDAFTAVTPIDAAPDDAAPDEVSDKEDSALSDADWDVEDDVPEIGTLEDAAPEAASVVTRDEETADEPVQKPATAASIPLTLKIAALETAVSKIAADWEPDGDVRDALAASDVAAMAWEDDVELDARGAPFAAQTPDVEEAVDIEEPVVAPVQAAAAPSGSAFGTEDQLMDEEALRDLVGEIVRAELQGALGERITRNVRKLVRREIHRALTAQEME